MTEREVKLFDALKALLAVAAQYDALPLHPRDLNRAAQLHHAARQAAELLEELGPARRMASLERAKEELMKENQI